MKSSIPVKVTIIEDDVQIAELLKEVLENDGFDVMVRDQASIQSLVSCPPDVLICDMNLPGGNGADLCRELSKRLPRCSPILMTGDLDSSNDVSATADVTFPILRKPFTLSSFLHLVREFAGICKANPAA